MWRYCLPRRSWNQSAGNREPFGLVVAVPDCRIGFATTDARRRLGRFFPRPRRAGMLPQEICRWLEDPQAARKPLVVRRAESRLIVRRVAIPTREAITLSLELVPKAAPASARRHRKLTRRENEVLHWLAEGKTTPEIAQILDLAAGTVSKHIEHIFQKLGVETRTAAAGIYAEADGHRAAAQGPPGTWRHGISPRHAASLRPDDRLVARGSGTAQCAPAGTGCSTA